MFTDIDLFNPTFIINCAELTNAEEVYSIFRQNDTRLFSYVILATLGEVQPIYLKVGESAPNGKRSTKGQVGERIVRQISNFDGFANGIPASSNGCDLRKGVDRLIANNQLPATFDKNNLLVAVWDLTTLSWDSLNNDPRTKSRCAEGQLANQIRTMAQSGTLLNIINPERNKAYRLPKISKRVFDSMFEIKDN